MFESNCKIPIFTSKDLIGYGKKNLVTSKKSHNHYKTEYILHFYCYKASFFAKVLQN